LVELPEWLYYFEYRRTASEMGSPTKSMSMIKPVKWPVAAGRLSLTAPRDRLCKSSNLPPHFDSTLDDLYTGTNRWFIKALQYAAGSE
jgi:hypothetical protein